MFLQYHQQATLSAASTGMQVVEGCQIDSRIAPKRASGWAGPWSCRNGSLSLWPRDRPVAAKFSSCRNQGAAWRGPGNWTLCALQLCEPRTNRIRQSGGPRHGSILGGMRRIIPWREKAGATGGRRLNRTHQNGRPVATSSTKNDRFHPHQTASPPSGPSLSSTFVYGLTAK